MPGCPPVAVIGAEILTNNAFEHALGESGFADDEPWRLASTAIDQDLWGVLSGSTA